jgi:hypothetical protein
MGIVAEVNLKKEVIMPGGDRTGPNAAGPMTGKRLGFCAGNDRTGFEMNPEGNYFNYASGYGRGCGPGRGMRYRHGMRLGRFYNVTDSEDSHVPFLENEVRILKDQLLTLEKQVSDLKNKK